MSQQRVFSEQEVSQILRRAVELSEERGESYAAGITRDELEKIAAEVGVSADALARAILEAGTRPSKRGPLHMTEEFERVVDGELDPGNFDVVIEGVKPFSKAGQQAFAQVGRTLSMSTWVGVGQANVNVTSRNGRTKLSVKSNALFQGLMTLHPSFIATLITVASMAERGMGLLGAAIGVGIMTAGVGLFTKLTKVGHRKAEKLADEMRDRIAEAVQHQDKSQSKAVQEDLQQRLTQS